MSTVIQHGHSTSISVDYRCHQILLNLTLLVLNYGHEEWTRVTKAKDKFEVDIKFVEAELETFNKYPVLNSRVNVRWIIT